MEYAFSPETINWLKQQTFLKETIGNDAVREDLINFLYAKEGKKRGELFGKTIKEARENLGLTQGEAAEKAGMTETEWTKYESGDAHPKDADEVAKFAQALDLDPLELIGKTLDKSPLFAKK